MGVMQHQRAIQTVCLLILTILALGAAIHWLRPVLVPFVLAVFLATALTPLIDLQMKKLHLPRPVAILTSLLIGCLFLVVLGSLVSTSVSEMIANAGEYTRRIQELEMKIIEWLPGDDDATEKTVAALVPEPAIGNLIVGTGNALLASVKNGVLVLVFLGFLLVSKSRTRPNDGGPGAAIESSIRQYIITKTSTSALTGVLVGSTLAAFGVQLAFVFGLFAFLLNFIPSIGSIVACLLPVPIVLLMEAPIPMKVAALAIPGGIQFVLGNIVEPKILGESLKLHPIAIILSLIFWGMLWGVIGMFLAVPITAALKIFADKINLTPVFQDVLAGRLDRLDTD